MSAASPSVSRTGPSSVTRPCSRATTRSAASARTFASWLATTTVAPASAAALMARTHAERERGSSPAVGSSSSRSPGRSASTEAMATRRCCPPESASGDLPPSSSRESPMRARASADRARASASAAPRARRPKPTSRSTVVSKNCRSGIWKTSPTAAESRRAPAPPSASAPSTASVPVSGRTMPAMTSSSVVLPEPVCPMSPVTPPTSSSVTSSSARTFSPAGASKARPTPSRLSRTAPSPAPP